jgi:hypothetical protein
MALTSPGVEVSVINESFYVPSDAGTTPLFIVASGQDKTNGAGDGTAAGTQTANANTAYLISSQRELTETFGDPKFYTDASGNPLHGYELNEWGLQAAYSFLGVANRAFVLRANVDTSDLVGSATPPTANPTDASYWFDLASSNYGLFEWSQTNQTFTAITPILITLVADLVGGVSTGAPLTSIGQTGSYAINTTHVSNKIFKKTASNTWVQVGASAWHTSLPIFSVASGTTVTNGHTLVINGTTITVSGTSLTNVATAIGTNATNVTASVNSVTGNLEIFHNGLALGDSTAGTNSIRIEEGTGLLASLGITAGTYNGPRFLQAAHTSRPTWKTADENRPNGSVWFKTTAANSGANIVAKLYSSASASFSTVAAPLHDDHSTAIFKLDPANGGTGLSVGDLYTQFNITEESITAADAADTTPNLGDFQLFRYEGGATTVTSLLTSPSFTSSDTFTIKETRKNVDGFSTAVTVTLGGTGADDFVAAVNAKVNANASSTSTTELINVRASKLTTGEIVLTHVLGGDIRLVDGDVGTPLADAGFDYASTAHVYGTYTANSSTLIDNLYTVPTGESMDSTANRGLLISNWKRLSYTASVSAPSNEPADGTLWYDTSLEADIMAHNGTTWVGYATAYSTTDPNGPQFSATAPTTQSDGTALVTNDLWIDTSDLENYPKLYKYNTAATLSSTNTANQVAVTTTGAAWVLVDKTDQTTEDGVVFADARWHTDTDSAAGTSTAAGTKSTIKNLLSDGFLDPDAPDPALFPQGIMLYNTRRSGYNVKEYKNSYITTTKYPGSGSSGLGNIRFNSNESVSTYYPDRWVTKSSNNADGSGSFGRKSQRKVIVEQLKSEIDTNQAIREDQRGYNIIATPGYPELIQNMINLNTDRNETAFIVGDTPLRLEGTSTAIQDWANNSASALDNGEDGLVSASDYLGVFYPSGLTTDNTGKSIVVPASHMMLRTLANNDSVAFPWFAPSGTRRGVVDNATAVGYIDTASGEFETISVTESVRDSMHEVKINPITFFAGAGIVNFGNLTKTSASSALDRINVSRLAVYLRTQLDAVGKPFIFEPNDELTRNEIKGAIESFLLELVGQRALFDFLVVCDDTNNTPTRIDRNELYVDIAIEPVKSVEFIYIPLRIKNTGEIAKLGN